MTSPLIHARTEWSGFLPVNTSICLFDVLQFFPVSTHSVHPLLRDRPPHAAPGVRHVPGIPGDEVDVEVHHGLAGGGADVHADVVAVGVEPAVEEGSCLPDEGEEGGLFRVGRVEEGGDVAVGDEEEVAGTPVNLASFIPYREGTRNASSCPAT